MQPFQGGRFEGGRAGVGSVEHEGETLLYVSGCVAEAYAGFVVDVEESPEGLRFGVGPPEAGHFARS